MEYPYRMLGEGGEHIVLNEPYLTLAHTEQGTPENDDGDMLVRKYSKLAFVVCNTDPLLPIAERYALATARAARTQERFDRLENMFPLMAAHQTSIGNIALLGSDEMQYIWGHIPHPPAGMHATVLTVQDRVPALMRRPVTARSIDVSYVEQYGSPVDPDIYAAVCQRWLTNADDVRPPSDDEIKAFYTVQNTGSIFPHRKAGTLSTPQNRGLRAFAWYAAEYTDATGEILDLANEKNVIMNDYGEFTLVDALYPSDIPLAQVVPVIVQKAQSGEALSYRDHANLLNGLGYMRSINFLLGSYKQQNTINTLAGMNIKPDTWKTIYASLSRFTIGAAGQSTAIYAD
jgi:hypothetical protein